MSGPEPAGTQTEPNPPAQPVAQPTTTTTVQPSPPPRTSGFDGRSLAIGAGAGLLVLLIAGIAYGAGRFGVLDTSDHQGAPRSEVVQPGPGGPHQGPIRDQRGPKAPDQGPTRQFRGLPGFGIPGALAERHEVTISAISGSDLTVATPDGWTRTITVAGTTKITRAGQTITLADLKVGDELRFQEQRNADGTYAVTAIEVVLPHVAGRVTAVSGDTITVERADGTTMAVHVSSATTYRVRGVDNATLVDITVGSVIVAQGTQNADGSLQALAIAALKR